MGKRITCSGYLLQRMTINIMINIQIYPRWQTPINLHICLMDRPTRWVFTEKFTLENVFAIFTIVLTSGGGFIEVYREDYL